MVWWSGSNKPEKAVPAKIDVDAEVTQALALLEQGEAGAAWNVLVRHASELQTRESPGTLLNALLKHAEPPTDEVVEMLLTAWEIDTKATLLLCNRVCSGIADAGFEDDALAHAKVERVLLALRRAEAREEAQGGDRLRAGLRKSIAEALRHAGPARAGEARVAYEALRDAAPEDSASWYNLGLVYKQRGLFAEGVVVNRRARELGDGDAAVLWNLGICATGAGDGATALEAWRALGFEVERGEDGLPFMPRLGPVQVRLSNAGVPGWEGAPCDYEHVWIERLSPCHGRVLSPTSSEMSAEYGDVVLHDGAAIGYRESNGRRTPRFPLLALLRKGTDRVFRFAALQEEEGQAAALTELLPEGSLVYPHTERVEMICRDCVRGGGRHMHRAEAKRNHRQLFGKLIVPTNLALSDFIRQLQAVLSSRPHLRFAAPALHSGAGDTLGARRAQQLWEEIEAQEG